MRSVGSFDAELPSTMAMLLWVVKASNCSRRRLCRARVVAMEHGDKSALWLVRLMLSPGVQCCVQALVEFV